MSAARRPRPEPLESAETPSRARSADPQPVVDQRLTTACEDIESLIEILDLDDLDDLVTFFQFLLGRPVAVELIDAEGDEDPDLFRVRDRDGVRRRSPVCVCAGQGAAEGFAHTSERRRFRSRWGTRWGTRTTLEGGIGIPLCTPLSAP